MTQFRFGNAVWGFRELELEAQLKLTAEMGLHIHELGIANAPTDLPLDVSDRELEQVKALYHKYDVELLCAATGNDFTLGDGDVERVKKATDICAKLGVKLLRIFAGFSPVEEVTGARWQTMIGCLNECAAYAKAKAVTLTVETHGGVNGFEDGEVEHFASTTTTAETLTRMLKELDESIMFLYDPANLYAMGLQHPNELYQVLRGRVATMHLKDFKTMPSGHKRPAACGESEMDWAEILEGLSDFHGPMLFEYELPEDLADGLNRSYTYIKKEIER